MARREYRPSDDMVAFDRMVEQLAHAVEHFNGKTTITAEDIRLMRAEASALRRYDEMAA
jgi:hypothetical protein